MSAGQLLAFLFLPGHAFNLILGFVAFRCLIFEALPIRKLEPLGKGVGIMADDLLAGVLCQPVLQLLNHLF